MIGRSGERGSGISVLAARHDDDDDDNDIYVYVCVCVYACVCVCVCVCTTFSLLNMPDEIGKTLRISLFSFDPKFQF